MQFNYLSAHTHTQTRTYTPRLVPDNIGLTYSAGGAGARREFCCATGEETGFEEQYWQYFTKIFMSFIYGKIRIITDRNSTQDELLNINLPLS